jgi:hypothetical protein
MKVLFTRMQHAQHSESHPQRGSKLLDIPCVVEEGCVTSSLQNLYRTFTLMSLFDVVAAAWVQYKGL